MSETERELLKITKLKPEKYEDRQDLLSALTLHVSDNLTEDQFRSLSDDAFNWYELARAARDRKQEIPEFLDHEPLDEYDATPTIAEKLVEIGASIPDSEWDKITPVPKKKSKTGVARYDEVTGEKDKWGITKGTKTSDAMAMFEAGASMADVQTKLGGRYYNTLRRLQAEGHLVEKMEGGQIRLTYKGGGNNEADELSRTP